MSKRLRSGSSAPIKAGVLEQQQQQQQQQAGTFSGSNDFRDFLLALSSSPRKFFGDGSSAAATGSGVSSTDFPNNSHEAAVNILDLPLDPVVKYKLDIEANFSLRCLLQDSAFDSIQNLEPSSAAAAQLALSFKEWREHRVVHVYPYSYSSPSSSTGSGCNLSSSEMALICDPAGYYAPDILAPEPWPSGDSSTSAQIAALKCTRLQFQYAIVSVLDLMLSGTSDSFYIMGSGAASSVYFNAYFYSKSRNNVSGTTAETNDSFECILSGVRNNLVQRILARGCDVFFIERAHESLTLDQRRSSQLARGTNLPRTIRISGRDDIVSVVDCIAELALQNGRGRKFVDVPAIISSHPFRFSTAKEGVVVPVTCSHDFDGDGKLEPRALQVSDVAGSGDSSSSSGVSKTHRVKVTGNIFAHKSAALYTLLKTVAKMKASASCDLEPLFVRPEERSSIGDEPKIDPQNGQVMGAAGGVKNPLIIGVRSRAKSRAVASNAFVFTGDATAAAAADETYFRMRFFSSDDARDFCYRSDARNDTTINSLTWSSGLEKCVREQSDGSVVAMVDKEVAERCRIVNHKDDDLCRKAAASRLPLAEYTEEDAGVVLEPANKYSIFTN